MFRALPGAAGIPAISLLTQLWGVRTGIVSALCVIYRFIAPTSPRCSLHHRTMHYNTTYNSLYLAHFVYHLGNVPFPGRSGIMSAFFQLVIMPWKAASRLQFSGKNVCKIETRYVRELWGIHKQK